MKRKPIPINKKLGIFKKYIIKFERFRNASRLGLKAIYGF